MADRDDEGRAAIAKALMERIVPQFSAETIQDRGPPKLEGGLTMPLGAGHISAQGSFQSIPQGRPEYGARLQYQRRF